MAIDVILLFGHRVSATSGGPKGIETWGVGQFKIVRFNRRFSDLWWP